MGMSARCFPLPRLLIFLRFVQVRRCQEDISKAKNLVLSEKGSNKNVEE